MNLGGGEDVNVFQILFYEILLRLPVQSLLRFRCVCKEWRTLIDGSHFKDTYLVLRRAMAVDDQLVGIKTRLVTDIPFEDMDRDDEHVTRSLQDLSRGLYLIYVTRWSGDYQSLAQYTLPCSSSSSSSSSCNDFELPGNYSGVILIINHVHGLVCILHGNNWFDISLVNPALRETRKLPIPVFDFAFPGFKPQAQGIGFGYDDSSNDYKLVAIVTIYEEGHVYSNYPLKHIGTVYHLSTNSWTVLGDMSRFVYSPFVSFPYQDSVFSHGSLHWCMLLKNDDSPHDKYRILAFDLTNELFREIPFPRGYRYYTPYEDDAKVPRLYTFDKSTVALVASTVLPRVEQELEVWVMKEYGDGESWTKLYSISNLPSFWRAICFWKKDRLLVAGVGSDLICYDLLKGEVDEHEECYSISLSGIGGLQLVTGHQSFVSVKLQA